MKKVSVKTKIVFWLTMLTALLAVLLVIFMMAISNRVSDQTAEDQLVSAVRNRIGQIHMEQGKPKLGKGFRFYQNGVTMLIYSKKETLLAGQIPISFVFGEPFQNGLVRMINAGEIQYFMLDLWVSDGWDNGVWVRGLIEAPDNRMSAYHLLH